MYVYKSVSVCVCVVLSFLFFLSFVFGFENGMWDFTLLLSDHCLSVCFLRTKPRVPLA